MRLPLRFFTAPCSRPEPIIRRTAFRGTPAAQAASFSDKGRFPAVTAMIFPSTGSINDPDGIFQEPYSINSFDTRRLPCSLPSVIALQVKYLIDFVGIPLKRVLTAVLRGLCIRCVFDKIPPSGNGVSPWRARILFRLVRSKAGRRSNRVYPCRDMVALKILLSRLSGRRRGGGNPR